MSPRETGPSPAPSVTQIDKKKPNPYHSISLDDNIQLLWISLISVSKSTLVFNLNPIFTMILAAISLREKLDNVALASVTGAFIGIFLLSLNKGSSNQNENIIGGLLWAFAGAWCESFIFVLCRMLNIYQIHPWLRPAYIGIVYIIFTALVLAFIPDYILFPYYTLSDFLYLSLSGFGNSYWIGFMALSLKYQSASKVAPLFYLENVFSLLSDIFVFNYSFSFTDYIGKRLKFNWIILL